MTVANKRESLLLFVGDIFFFYLSLWLMLFFAFLGVADLESSFGPPYSIFNSFCGLDDRLFVSGLYEKHTLILKSKLPTVIFNAQIANSIIAVLFFYFIPAFGITPKTNLFIYLAVSFILILSWRLYSRSLLGSRKKEKAILIGSGPEMRELEEEVNNNSRYNLQFISSVELDDVDSLDFQEEILKRVYSEDVHVIAADLRNEKVQPILPNLYNLIFSKVRFIDMYKIYEDIFDRIPLSLVRYNWFLENISITPHITYDFLKRAMDIFVAVVIGVISLILYPFVALCIKLDDGGPIFFSQERVIKNNQVAKIWKFRTMAVHTEKDGLAKGESKVTRVGKFLRASRVDELPQLWNVFNGDISLIGPRPELPVLVKLYEKEIPYYNIRHLIKPGLSGWAALYQKTPPKFSAQYDATKTKLSYDLYYIKNRSFMLDFKIALKTLTAVLSRSGV